MPAKAEEATTKVTSPAPASPRMPSNALVVAAKSVLAGKRETAKRAAAGSSSPAPSGKP